MAEDEKKSIFDKAFDALSSKDEKKALEEMQQKISELEAQLAAAKKAAEDAQTAAAKIQASASRPSVGAKDQSQAAITQANQRAQEAENRTRELEAQLQRYRLAQMKEELAKQQTVTEAKFIAEHELKADETLSHLALHYYGHATPPYWKLIYEANKELIGDNPNRVHPGLLIKIPELPEELKDK